MKHLIRELWPAVALILGASALLLLSDLKQRQVEREDPDENFISSGVIKYPAEIFLKQDGSSPPKQRTIDFEILKEKDLQPSVEDLLQADLFLNLNIRNGKAAKIILITLVENLVLEQAIAGVEAGLNKYGLISGKDYVIKKYSAQGEIGQLPQIIDAAIREKPDAVVTVTTPAFITAARKILDIPLIFTVASDPYKLKIFKDKRPDNICGIHDNPPVDKLLRMASKFDSNLKKAGIIYDAAQINSLISVEKLRLAGKEQGIQILEATAFTVSDLAAAAQSLIQRGAEAFIISADNLAYTGFPAILKVAKGADIPIYVTESELVSQGASGAIGDNFHEWGKQSGELVAKVLAGVPPSRLPVAETKNQQVIEPKK